MHVTVYTGSEKSPHSSADADTFRVIQVDAQTDPRWKAFVASHPDSSVCHHPDWMTSLERVYGFKPLALACENAAEQLIGVLPLMYSRQFLTGPRLSSLPRTRVAGPVGTSAEVCAALVKAAHEHAMREPGTQLEIRTYMSDLGAHLEGIVGVPQATAYVTRLPTYPQELRFGNSRTHHEIKRKLKQGAKMGLHVREAETENDLRAWYRLYLETMRWHAWPPQPYREFKMWWDVLRPQGLLRLLLAEQHVEGRVNRLVAGNIFLMFGGTVAAAINGRSKDDLSLRPNEALHWAAIHDAWRDGYRWYDAGRAREGDGLSQFKSKWNGEPKTIFHYYYRSSTTSQSTRAHTSRAVNLVRAVSGARQVVWRRLPLPVTALIGNWVYDYF